MSKSIIAMVPVRAGSIRVLEKNTRTFADTNLLELKLNSLKRLKGIDGLVVSTDCEKSAEIAQKFGAEVQWRDDFFAGSNVTNDQHWYHIAKTTPGEVVFMAQVTSPLVRVSSMQRALDQYLLRNEKISINSVSAEKKFLWENGVPVNYNISQTPKSQDLPEIVSLNFAITIISREEMMHRKNVIGEKPVFVELDKVESLDIDDYLDFEIAETIFKNRGKKWLLS